MVLPGFAPALILLAPSLGAGGDLGGQQGGPGGAVGLSLAPFPP